MIDAQWTHMQVVCVCVCVCVTPIITSEKSPTNADEQCKMSAFGRGLKLGDNYCRKISKWLLVFYMTHISSDISATEFW